MSSRQEGISVVGRGKANATPSDPVARLSAGHAVTRRRLLARSVFFALGCALGPGFALNARKAFAEEGLVKIEESDPLGSAFGYVHDASKVDTVQFPKRAGEAGATQFCNNCAVFTAAADAEWGPCSILPGKLVKGVGWCNAWAPK